MDLDFEYINLLNKLEKIENTYNYLETLKADLNCLPELESDLNLLIKKVKLLKESCKKSIEELLDEVVAIAEVLEDTDYCGDYFY